MKWNHPPIIKIYEALGAVADGRVSVEGSQGKVMSSSGNKSYDVSYDLEQNAIMANDNASYWKGDLGYPAIAFLMENNVITYDKDVAKLLKGIAWKDVNQKFKNDFDKTLEYILSTKNETEIALLTKEAHRIDNKLKELNLDMLGKKVKPPVGY